MVTKFIQRSPQYKIMEKVKAARAKKTFRPDTPSRDVSLSKQEYLQETSEYKQEVGAAKSQYQKTMESIKPGQTYVYRGQQVPGVLLKRQLHREYGRGIERAEIQSQRQWSQARDLPQGTRIVKTQSSSMDKQGDVDKSYIYKFSYPDQRLEFTKRELQKIEKAPPGVKQVAKFGFGAVSSIGALGKPILDYTIGDEYSRRQHFVSPMDIAFEPIGWSPKGSTKILRENPFFAAGGVSAEVLQAYGFGQLGKGVSYGVRTGVKYTVRKIPSVVGKVKSFTGVTSKYGLKTGAVRVGGKSIGFVKTSLNKPSIITKAYGKISDVGKTSFWRNISGYSKGELVFAKSYPLAKGYPITKKYASGTIQKFRYKGIGKRVLVSPSAVKSEMAGQNVFFKFYQVGDDVTLQKFHSVGIGKPKGVIFKRIDRTIGSYTPLDDIGYQKLTDVGGGGYVKLKASDDVLRSTVMASKRDISRSFLSSDDAYMSLVRPQVSTHYTGYTKGFGGRRLAGDYIISGLGSSPALVTGSSLGLLGGYKVMSALKQENIVEKINSNIQRNMLKSDVRYEQLSKSRYNVLSDTDIMQRSILSQKQDVMRDIDYKLLQVSPVTSRVKLVPISSLSGGYSVAPFYFDDSGLDVKRKIKNASKNFLDVGLRSRTWKVPTVKQLLGV